MMFDRKLFSASILAKMARDALSLRDVAKSTGVSVATLSRVARGHAPDVDSFAKIVKWLDIDANAFIGCPRGGQMREIEKWSWLALCLRDLNVPQDLIQAIITIVKLIEK